MKISAIANCYGNFNFTGTIEIEITDVKEGWYRLPLFYIHIINGDFQIEKGDEFRGFFSIKTSNGTEIRADGTIAAKEEPFIGHGYLSGTESRSMSPTSDKILVRKKTKITYRYSELNYLQFIPDDQIGFSNRAEGYCTIEFSLL